MSMEILELILLLLACVVASSMLDQMLSRISLPLIQIAVGFVVALILPRLADVYVDSEVFMMLFIAPLLFREAKETSRPQLWKNIGSVLSMAIALVVVTVLVAGFCLNLIIPSIPLAAAFACAAALGPTDAAAVAALGSTIHLTKRQSTLLSGESLINDASGVVSFQFAIAAAVTGAFSVAQATGTFAVLFFGGIAIGLVLGFILKRIMMFMRRKGYLNTISFVVYEVLSPFLIFLVAEELHLSGVLAVVAAGLLMQEHNGNIVSPETAQRELVSNSFWEVIIFLINGVIFVMLGMQLPKVMHPDVLGEVRLPVVIGAVLAVTAAVIVTRWIWLIVMELHYKDPDTGERGTKAPGRTVREALVTTIAGPKGAVTLSIIMTIPLTVDDGGAFPKRDLIIFITAGAILCTLLLADFLLPRLSPKPVDLEEEKRLDMARIKVLDGVVTQLRRVLDDYADSEFAPATRLAVMRYRRRLLRLRFSMDECGEQLEAMADEVLEVQQERADEIQKDAYHIPASDRMPYYMMLPTIRSSLGYFGGAEKVGAQFEERKDRVALGVKRYFKKHDFNDEQTARIYYDTCIFAIDLEQTAINYLNQKLEEAEAKGDDTQKRIARVLLDEHDASLQSLWGRINYGQDTPQDPDAAFEHGFYDKLPEGMKNNTMEQFMKAMRYTDEVDANALEMELDQIRSLRMGGEITDAEARTLREEVYLIQTSFLRE